MRRMVSAVVGVTVGAMLVAACSSSGGVSVSTDPDARDTSATEISSGPSETSDTSTDTTTDTSTDTSTDTTTDASTDTSTSDSSSDAAASVELPGLLDTSDESIPNDDAVRTGTLDNGLDYMVRANDNPGSKAELRLVIDAGSVDEFGPSTGVAHFVEHMLFNGTEQYPENELIDLLRSFGAAFGADVNAYTSFDETVYTLTVPNTEESVDAGMSILEQWLSHATFDPDQVVAERGVVADEWRVRTQSNQGRLFDVAESMYLPGTPYDGRSPIGDIESIEAMDADELRDYYDTWYRPDNATVIIVGDIDVDEMVSQVEELFGPAGSRSDTTPQRPDTRFDLETVVEYGLHADPDQQTVDVEVTLPLPSFDGPADGTAALRVGLLDQMIYDALVRRLDDDITAGTAPFDQIAPGTNSFVSGLDAPALYAFTDAERSEATLQALLDEYAGVDRHGFTERDADVARARARVPFENRYDGRESTQDTVYADQYVDHALRGAPYPPIDVEFDIVTAELDEITADAMNDRFRARWANSAPHVIISTPLAEADQVPTEDEVFDMIAALGDREIDPRAEAGELPDELMERPAPVEPDSVDLLLDSGNNQYFDPVMATFPNGVTVIVTSNPIVEGQVYYQGSSPGGSSLVADDDVIDALYAADIVTSSGVADFNQSELNQIIADDDVALGAWIAPYIDNLGGSAATGDLEVLFQLINLYMTQPRFDQVALGQVDRAYGPVITDPGSDPSLASDDALLESRYGDEVRYAVLPTPEQFATLDLEGVERVWNGRYGDASDWTFVFAGDVEVTELLSLAGSYLGTLPGGGDDETWVDVSQPVPPGVVTSTVNAGTGDTATVSMLFTSPVDDVDASLRARADIATQVLSARLTDVLREEFGESYSPFAVSYITYDPDPTIETYVSVSGAPDRVAEIEALVIDEFADLAAEGPTEREFSNASAQVLESYNFVNNDSFIEELMNTQLYPTADLNDYIFQSAALQTTDAASVQAFIATYVPADQYIEVTTVPR